ncbi:MAG: T9SS type A sorting domain-containing protein [Flavobacteriales bacterium]|nr:T9SS type A sorting domain-containing protein [Flavobacteriales bacterium]
MNRLILPVLFLFTSLRASAQFGDPEMISDNILLAGHSYSIGYYADVDLDNDSDYVEIIGNMVQVNRNNGPVQFHISQQIATGLAPRIYVGKFDADNLPDIFIIDNNFHLSIYTGNGDATFEFSFEHILESYGSTQMQLQFVPDLNGDELPDLFTYYSPSGVFVWHLSSMSGYTAATTTLAQSYLHRFNDLDGDGDIDITLDQTLVGPTISYLENDGYGNFTQVDLSRMNWTTMTPSYGNNVRFDNFDDDPEAELLCSWYTSGPTVHKFFYYDFMNPLATPQEVILPGVSQHYLIIDTNGDGYKDVVTQHYTWYNNAGSFDNPLTMLDLDPLTAISSQSDFPLAGMDPIKDMDGDGDEDYIAFDNDMNILYTNGDGTFTSELVFDRTEYGGNLMAADISGDGITDFIHISTESFFSILGDENVNINPPFVFDTDILSYYSNVSNGVHDRIYDTNNDGVDEFVYLADSMRLKSVTLDSSGQPNVVLLGIVDTSGIQSYYSTIHDLNQDLWPDIFLFGTASDGTTIFQTYLSNNGSYDLANTTSIDMGELLLQFKDMNGDGFEDIFLLQNHFSGMYYIGDWAILYDGTSFNLTELTVTDAYDFVFYQDMTNDGYADALIYQLQAIELHIGDGNGTFTYDHTITTTGYNNDALMSTNVDIPDFVDVDNDGDMDFFSSAIIFDEIDFPVNYACLYLQDNGTFDSLLVTGMPNVYFDLADINQDGTFDIYYPNTNNAWQWIENYLNAPLSINAFAYYDLNADGNPDPNEPFIESVSAELNTSILTQFVDEDGIIRIILPQSGTYDMTILYDEELWSLSGGSNEFTFTIDESMGILDYSIGLIPTTAIDSVIIDISSTNLVCNNTMNIWVTLQNAGNTFQNGSICVQISEDFALLSTEPQYVSNTNNLICFDVSDLPPGQSLQYQIVCMTPGVDFMGQTFSTTASYTGGTISDEQGPIHTMLCAFDPNDIQEHTGYTPSLFVNGSNTLEYTIRFQNTGNYLATNVVIENALSNLLDWSSIHIVASSHNMESHVTADGALVFTFNSIMLPDSTSDFSGSQGFVRYNITPVAGLAAGTLIPNDAAIYFDLNPAIITNTVQNTIYHCDDLEQTNISTFEICEGSEIAVSNNAIWIENILWETGDMTLNQANGNIQPTASGQLNMTVSNSLCAYDQNWEFTVYDPSVSFESNGNTLTSTDAQTYQWYLNGSPVDGATSQTLDISASGNYQVVITDEHGCSATSIEQFVTYTGIDYLSTNHMSVYPNPANDQFTFVTNANELGAPMHLFDATGRLVLASYNIQSSQTTFDIHDLKEGLYLLQYGDRRIPLNIVK